MNWFTYFVSLNFLPEKNIILEVFPLNRHKLPKVERGNWIVESFPKGQNVFGWWNPFALQHLEATTTSLWWCMAMLLTTELHCALWLAIPSRWLETSSSSGSSHPPPHPPCCSVASASPQRLQWTRREAAIFSPVSPWHTSGPPKGSGSEVGHPVACPTLLPLPYTGIHRTVKWFDVEYRESQ